MTVSKSPRLGLTRWSDDADPWSRDDFDDDNAALEAKAVIYAEGDLAARPTFGVNGRIYDAQDVGLVYYDTGSAWVTLSEEAGIIKFCAGTTPANTMACEGAVLNRAEHPRLFNAIGTNWNTGGETISQFRLPDFRGRVLLGAGSGKIIGAKGGAESVPLTAANMPLHDHTITDPGHAHRIDMDTEPYAAGASYSAHFGQPPTSNPDYGMGDVVKTQTTGIDINPAGNATPTPVSVMQPWAAVNVVITI